MSEPQKISPEAIPLLCEGVNIKSLDITPEEGSILVQLDGQLRVRHLKMMTGLEDDKLYAILQNLSQKGIIILHQSKPKPGAELKKPRLLARNLIDLKNIPTGPQFEELVNKLMDALNRVDYFQLLGVSQDAGRDEIKRAYYRLSKVFHPDRYFQKVEPEFRLKLQTVFQGFSTAYLVLSKDDRKKAYLAQIAEKGVEAAVEELRIDVAKKVYTGPKMKLGLNEDKEKQKDEKLKGIVDKIKQTAMGGQFQKAERIYQMALTEVSKKNFKSARTNLKLVLQLNPAGGEKYRAELERIDRIELELRGEVNFEEGRTAEESGEYQKASRSYAEALRVSPKNQKYLCSQARVMVKYLNNFEKGRALLIDLIEQDQKKADYFYLLGLAYHGLGQKRAAEVQLEKALQLDPKHRDAQKELKNLKRI